MSSTSFDYYVEFNIILLLELKIDREKKREKERKNIAYFENS